MYFCETLWNSTCSPIFMPENTYEKNIPQFPACDIDVQWWNFPGSTFHRMYKVRPIIVREDTSRIAEYFHYYLHILWSSTKRKGLLYTTRYCTYDCCVLSAGSELLYCVCTAWPFSNAWKNVRPLLDRLPLLELYERPSFKNNGCPMSQMPVELLITLYCWITVTAWWWYVKEFPDSIAYSLRKHPTMQLLWYMRERSSIVWSRNGMCTVVSTIKRLQSKTMLSLLSCIWAKIINTAVLVHEKSTRVECTHDTLDIIPDTYLRIDQYPRPLDILNAGLVDTLV